MAPSKRAERARQASLHRLLLEVYDRLLDRYGPQNWWPADSRFEIIIGAVLTQAAAWTNVEKALNRLKAAEVFSPQALRQIPEGDLAGLIYSAGYFNVKARKLKAVAAYLGERFNDDIDAMLLQEAGGLRRELLAVYGLGEETVDDILLYVAEKPYFVIDAYTRRITERLGLSSARDSYGTHQALFMEHLPQDAILFNEYHALLDEHAKAACRKEPLCRECCLLDLCPTGRARVAHSATVQ